MGRKSLPKPRLNDQQRKQAWAEELFARFQENGLRAVTMDEAASMLGVSKATLYKYFRSREEILACALGWKLDNIRRFREHLADPNLSYVDRFLGALGLASAELSSISTIFLADLRSLYPSLWEQIQVFIAQSLQDLRAFYEEGIAQGALANVHPGVLVATDESFFQRLADPDFLAAEDLTLREALGHYFTLKFGGLFPEEAKTPHRVQDWLAQFP